MAVYSEVSADEAGALLRQLKLGELKVTLIHRFDQPVYTGGLRQIAREYERLLLLSLDQIERFCAVQNISHDDRGARLSQSDTERLP